MVYFYQRKKIERKYLLYIHEISVKSYPCLLILSDFKIANLKMLSVIVWLRICTKFTCCQYIILIFHCSWFQVTIHLLLVVHSRESSNVSWFMAPCMHLHKILRNLFVNMLDSTNALLTNNLFIYIDYHLSKDDWYIICVQLWLII